MVFQCLTLQPPCFVSFEFGFKFVHKIFVMRRNVGGGNEIILLLFSYTVSGSSKGLIFDLNITPAIAAHGIGAISLSFFIFDSWDCDRFWYIFGFCRYVRTLPVVFLFSKTANCFTYIHVRHSAA